MRRRAVHQILVGAGPGDAITSMAIRLRELIRTEFDSEIYAHHLSPEVAHEVHPLVHLGPTRRDDVLIYHSSIGEPEVTGLLLRRSERLVLIYHNITPAELFIAHSPQFAAHLHWGRHELTLLRSRVALAVADSQFNADDLRAAGYSDVHVVPAGLRPSRLRDATPDAALATRLGTAFPGGYVLALSQVLPHKRFETIIQAMHLVQWVHELTLGLLIVGAHRMQKYHDALVELARHLRVDRVWFFGSATDSELATMMRLAGVLVTTSAHEGLALPPLEAMSFGVPVIARSAGALADTIGDGGLVLPPDAGPVLVGEAIAEVTNNESLRRQLIGRGHRRAAAVEAENLDSLFLDLVREVR